MRWGNILTLCVPCPLLPNTHICTALIMSRWALPKPLKRITDTARPCATQLTGSSDWSSGPIRHRTSKPARHSDTAPEVRRHRPCNADVRAGVGRRRTHPPAAKALKRDIGSGTTSASTASGPQGHGGLGREVVCMPGVGRVDRGRPARKKVRTLATHLCPDQIISFQCWLPCVLQGGCTRPGHQGSSQGGETSANTLCGSTAAICAASPTLRYQLVTTATSKKEGILDAFERDVPNATRTAPNPTALTLFHPRKKRAWPSLELGFGPTSSRAQRYASRAPSNLTGADRAMQLARNFRGQELGRHQNTTCKANAFHPATKHARNFARKPPHTWMWPPNKSSCRTSP